MSQLYDQQMAFASHLRNPSKFKAPEFIESRRLKIYQDLFYNNIEGFVSGGFPVLRSITGDETWHRMVRGFFADYRCATPYFLEISQEFLNYVQTQRQPEDSDYPFLLELAHYEWVELAVDTDTNTIPETGYHPEGDLLLGRPLISPLAYVLSYTYPVHLIGPDYLPHEAPASPTFLIVYRTREFEVKFMEINALTAQLLSLLQAHETYTGKEVVMAVAQQLPHLSHDTVLAGGLQALEHLRNTSIILGTQLKPIG